MKTTVIIPVYNRLRTLTCAVRSLLAQACDVELDILIIDDGSMDETPDVVARPAQRHHEVRSVRRENGGVAKARNTGLENLRPDSQIVTFLDSDDVMAPGRFVKDMAVLRDGPEVEITYGKMVVANRIDPQTLSPPPDAIWRAITSIHLSCALFHRSLIDRIGPFDEQLRQAEDTDCLLRAFETGTCFVQTPTVCLYYLRHAGNRTKDTTVAKKSFVLAVLKSLQRRKADTSLRLDKSGFAIEIPRELI